MLEEIRNNVQKVLDDTTIDNDKTKSIVAPLQEMDKHPLAPVVKKLEAAATETTPEGGISAKGVVELGSSFTELSTSHFQ